MNLVKKINGVEIIIEPPITTSKIWDQYKKEKKKKI